MAAAYAAVVSLMNTMEQITNHPRLSNCFQTYQIKSLVEHLNFLLEYIESYNILGGPNKEVEDLERRIASAAHAAADVIESHVVDQIQTGFAEESPRFLVDLQKIIEDMSLIKEVVAKVKEEMPQYVEKSTNSTPAAPYGRRHASRMATIVGVDKSLREVYNRLTGGGRDREIITIVGLPGLGKTSLARHVYSNHITTKHFYYRAWANVSPRYNVRETLLQLISCLGRSTNKLVNTHEDELGRELYRMLSGMRYLIILDDMRGTGAWDKIECFFPENNIGSRIIVTTRLFRLASCISSNILVMETLDVHQSWNLLCQTVFGNEKSCPPELEETGRKIVECCDGIPFFISVIGSFLGKSSRKQESWKYVMKSIGSIPNNSHDFYDQYRNILMFCYDALPSCLKPCFLYMGMFPEDSEIRVSRVVKLWIAEGFLKPRKGYSLEEVGESCMLELIRRNLISVSSRGSEGKPKICKINEFSRDLCMRIAEKENFFSFVHEVNTLAGIDNERRFVVHYFTAGVFNRVMRSSLLARSVICETPALGSFKSRLLRVLVEVYSDSLEATFGQVNLRFLAYESLHAPIDWMARYEIPSSISLIWNMQTLIIGKKAEIVVAPFEIWKMRQLRHVDIHKIHLLDPPTNDDEDESILQNLQTLGMVLNLECSAEVSKRMPNVKKLRVFYEKDRRKYWFSLFTKLESLNCYFHEIPNRDDLVQSLKFPSSLKKLVLQDCELCWNDLSIIGSLPFLEVLKLKCQSVRGPRWKTVEGEFVRLKYLEIDSCYLIYWTTGVSQFPILEKLVLHRLYRLKEIPSEMGYIKTLEEICVVECNISVAISAARILEKHEEMDNFQVNVRVGFKKEEEVAEFKAKMKLDGTRSSSLQIDGV